MNCFFKQLLSSILACCMTIGVFTCFTGAADESISSKKAQNPITITVGKNNSKYQFDSIQKAIDSISLEPTSKAPATIIIGAGVYEEVVIVNKPYINLKNETGENPNNVIITYDKANGHVSDPKKSAGTQKSATFTVEKQAIGFSADSITFQNSYNIGEENSERKQVQAVAFVSLADKVVLNNCRFIGRQDTLYLKGSSKGKDVFGDCNSSRVYLNKCYIEGTVDFIFGDATAYFNECTINMAYSDEGGHYTAANSTLSNIGFVFKKCIFTADSKYGNVPLDKIDLGRPWQSDSSYPYYGANTILIECELPSVLNPKGFILWDSNTVINKIRYMEYGSVNELKKPIDLNLRNEFVTKLTKEQAQTYSAFNVLRGNDNWNPSENKNYSENINVLSVSLNNYNISIPKNEKYSVEAIVLPLNSQNKDILWKSSDENIMTIDNNGVISALKEGKANVIAISVDGGFSVSAEVSVMPERTEPPVVQQMNIQHKDVININDVLTVSYSYNLKSDKDIDCAKIRWYAVRNDGNEFLVKQGDIKNCSQYTVRNEDIGYKIKAVIYPETLTSYGKIGEIASFVTETEVAEPNYNYPKTYIRDNFDSISQRWNNDGNFYVIDSDLNKFVTAKDVAFMSYNYSNAETVWNNVAFDLRMRFNPDNSTFSSESYYDFYSAFDNINSHYYKLRIKRGGNTNSLKVYLYKKADGKNEELVMSDELSLKDNIPQAKGEENPYFMIKQTINNGVVTSSITLDNFETPIMSMVFNDEEPIKGFTAFGSNGSQEAVLLDSIVIYEIINNSSSNDAVRIYLAGDSTVKSYGSDNTIGGWGEYLPYYFDNRYVQIINKAEGGRSTRSYINQGRLDEILNEIRPNDYLFIQFGHNDARTDENAYLEHSVPLGEPDSNGIYPTTNGIKTKTPKLLLDFYKDMPYSETFYSYDSGGNYKWFLKQYIDGAREKGAIPVLITPVARVFFDENGKITPHHGSNDEYVKAVLQVADEMNVVCVDMFQITKDMYENYGVKVTQGLQNIKSDGSMDITHYNKFGSNIVTSKLVSAIKDAGLAVGEYEIASSKNVSRTEDLKNANVFIVGETMAAGDDSESEYAISKSGWGEHIQKYFSEQITVHNLAKTGESSKSFINTQNYKNVFSNIEEGDYLLIQFGNGDANKEPNMNGIEKFTDPNGSVETKGSFKYYIYNYYVKPALDKKAVPILITPDVAMDYDNAGNQIYNENYVNAIKELAVEFGLYYVDMNSNMKSSYIYNADGNDYRDVFNSAYRSLSHSYSDNGIDRFSYSDFGAEKAAKVLLEQLGFSSATIKNYIDTEKLQQEKFVSRADFVSELVRLIPTDEFKLNNLSDNFSDIIQGKSYAKAISIAKQNGIIKQNESNLFMPEENIKKEDIKEFVNNLIPSVDNSIFDIIEDGSDVTEFQSAIIINRVYNIILSRAK